MKKLVLSLLLSICFFTISPQQTFAIENPLAVPNNKIGIHILFDYELPAAAALVNSSGGDWGYVTMPIQSKDRDIVRWQKFMDDAKKNHVIPLIRLATEADYFNNHVWRKPTHLDVIDFANFLDSLEWPTKNRYIIVFNEVNRGDEWGGHAIPSEYADLLSFAVSVFKSKNPDYFIISAGLDNAAPNQGTKFMNQYEYMTQMDDAVPGIFNQVDGLASHSYPNPGFSQPPNTTSRMGVGSFMYERQLIKYLSGKSLPVFITETGWSSEVLAEDTIVNYFTETLNTIWNDPNIVAITPFLLQGSGGPFQKFTFIGENNYLTKQYAMLQQTLKVKGVPVPPVSVLAAETRNTAKQDVKKRPFLKKHQKPPSFSDQLIDWTVEVYKWLMKI